MKLPNNFNLIKPPLGLYQKEVIGFGILTSNPGILLPMGTGKTYCAINIARYHIQKGFKKCLVICPSSIMFNWKNEIKEFSEYKPIVIDGNTRQDRISKLKNSNADFYIINYEALDPYLDALYNINFDIIIADESARFIKNITAKRTEAAIMLGDKALKRIILTGLLIANKPKDLWSQFRFLDKGETFGNNYYAWLNRTFFSIDDGLRKRLILKPNKIEYLKSSIYKNCIRKEKDECLKNLPEKIFRVVKVIPNNSFLKIYNDIRAKTISEIETEGGITYLKVPSILAKITRLQQVTSGFTLKGDKYVKMIETPKLDRLVEDISSIIYDEESVIVWCRFVFSIKIIEQALKKIKIPTITMCGEDNSPLKKMVKWKGFQESNKVNVFIGQVESGGIGIELFKKDSSADKSQYMYFYENTYVPDHKFQAIERIHRAKQKSTCMYVDLVVENTIDERILGSVMEKKKITDSILEKGVLNFF